jgi:WS/DGAT/MGAT family acyltransferase
MATTPQEPSDVVPPSSRTRASGTERRMSDVEAAMWNAEKDPYLSSTFGSVTVLEHPLDMDHFRLRLLRTASRIPRLHQRVVPGLGRLAPPEWHEDPDFDIDYHVRHLSLPAPGSLAQLFDLAVRIVHDPFDRTRPLWSFTVIDGVDGGRSAVVQKMHHTISDGVGTVRISEQYMDGSADLPEIDLDEIDVRPEPPSPDANVLVTAAGTIEALGLRTIGIVQRAAGETADVLRHPTKLGDLPGGVVATARSAMKQVIITDPARSPLWTSRSLHRWYTGIELSFDDCYRAAKALGGSLNDIFVTGVAGGAGAYHRARGAPVDVLRMAMPVSTRKDSDAGGNSFVPTRMLVPAGIVDPVERFEAMRAIVSETRADRVVGMAESFAVVANLLPTSVLVRLARQQTETIDFTASNVRAAPFDLYIAGARVESTYPIGPMAGTAFNVTMISYSGGLYLGLHVDSRAIADPPLLRDCVAASFDELIAAGS